MNSSLTVLDVFKTIGSLFSRGEFLSLLNQSCERLLTTGRWKGSMIIAAYDNGTDKGYITLGRRHLSAFGYDKNNVPNRIYSQYHEFQELGYGYREPSNLSSNGMIDMGDGYCTQSDIETAGVVRFKILDSNDVDKKIRIYGLDENGSEVFDDKGSRGIELTSANPTVDSTQQFSSITEITMDEMEGYTFLYVMNSGTPVLLGTYEPGETRPQYRRYKTGITDATIKIYCQRRFVPVTRDTDFVFPGNIGAIKAGMKAIKCEDSSNTEQAEKLWDLCQMILDQELKATRGRITPVLPFGGQVNPPPVRYVR